MGDGHIWKDARPSRWSDRPDALGDDVVALNPDLTAPFGDSTFREAQLSTFAAIRTIAEILPREERA